MSSPVEFRHLEYLVAIDEGKNFTRAAEKLYRSQPAISQQVRGLESDIGFPIFVRQGRDGVTPTPAGELVLGWARTVLEERNEIFAIARAIHRGEVPPLRLGFSSFVTPTLLTNFRQSYAELFPKCEVTLSGGDSQVILQRLAAGTLDCAILPCPIDLKTLDVIPVANSQLVVCMRTDDALASQSTLDIHEIAPRIRVFRDPELHPGAHARLVHFFKEVGIPISLANSVANPADIQWMVKEHYGLALIDEALPLDPGLTTRPIAGVNWSAHFSGAQTLMGTFKTFAIYAGAVICFGGLIFAGIRMMSGRFQDAIAKRLFHHLRPRIDKDPMHRGNNVAKLLCASRRE